MLMKSVKYVKALRLVKNEKLMKLERSKAPLYAPSGKALGTVV